MHITSIFVAGYRQDVEYTRCCVASIRRWYRHVPIYLIKDETAGTYDTADLETHHGVKIFRGPARRYGWGMSKLEPLFLPGRQKILILDSDTALAGPILDRLEQYSEDFVVAHESLSENEILSYYFDPAVIEQRYEGFRYPGYVFNTGQIVATTGILRREDFLPFVDFVEPRVARQPDLFFCGDQGLLNFVLFSYQQRGELTIARTRFMEWAGRLRSEDIDIARLESGPYYDFLVHWAGFKGAGFSDTPMKYVLEHFTEAYRRGMLPAGVWKNLTSFIRPRWPSLSRTT